MGKLLPNVLNKKFTSQLLLRSPGESLPKGDSPGERWLQKDPAICMTGSLYQI